ncbi:MFS transporter [Weissella diestrammenae]|uniref:MFS transporter n=1 Tax=Weissella diestrammenae TaxID=1162633 RepID=A0A7G9T5H0_9LACO|nr:MFS transporter [Weissella diestrammenae]MCM0583206.1 MFS transporter [Weissella diestrammenae]QNN75345.1 MFS transporter [Weissella diestrammenae]
MEIKEWQVLRAIIATGIMSFSGVLIETSMNVTFPTLMNEFKTTANGVQWVTTAYLLAIAVIVPLSAYFIRNFSARRLFVISNIFFFGGVLTDSFAPNLLILLFGRVLQGIGTGIALPLMFHIILTKSPFEKRGAMMGIGTMTTSIAPAIGPTYGGVVLTVLGWRAIFWFLIPLVISSLILGLKSIPNEVTNKNDKFNFLAFISLSIGLASLLIAVEKMSGLWLGMSLLALGVFYFVNRKNVLLNISIFRNSAFSRLLLSVLVYQAMFLGLSFILPNYLQLGLHQSSTTAGLFMFPGAVIGSFLGPISGRLLDELGAVKPISFGLIVSTLAVIGMTLSFEHASIWQLLIWHMMMMVGSGMAVNNLMTATLTQLDQKVTADGNSILNTLQQFSGAAATAIVASLFASTQHIKPNGVMIGSRYGLIMLLILFIISLVTFISVVKRIKL